LPKIALIENNLKLKQKKSEVEPTYHPGTGSYCFYVPTPPLQLIIMEWMDANGMPGVENGGVLHLIP
jgi:hypothetical protein